jgi:sarcosine oxidase
MPEFLRFPGIIAMMRYDLIVVGLGATGAAAAFQAAKRGARVLGIDRYAPPHTLGSSHGESRITRLAIGEGTAYTPFAMRSHEIWRAIEAQTGAELLTQNGGLMLSSANTAATTHVPGFFANTIGAAKRYGIAHEILDAAAIRRRFPQFAVTDEEIGYYEPAAGYLRPEACIRAELDLARRHGAEIRTAERVTGLQTSGKSVIVVTAKGTYAAEAAILAAGPWLPELAGHKVARVFTVRRQVLFWFAPNGDGRDFCPQIFPVFIWELPDRTQGIYGFPAIAGPDGGVKIATEQYRSATTADSVVRTVAPGEAESMFATYVGPYFPTLGRRCLKAEVCLYTVTPDAGFVIDRLPDAPRLILASPCSGHGFKHSAAIGEALAEWVLEGKSRIDLAPFRLARWTNP